MHDSAKIQSCWTLTEASPLCVHLFNQAPPLFRGLLHTDQSECKKREAWLNPAPSED